jgi:hypothetical protein
MGMWFTLCAALQLPLLALGAASQSVFLVVLRPALRRLLAALRPRLGLRRALSLAVRLLPALIDGLRRMLRLSLPAALWLAMPGCRLRSVVSLRRGGGRLGVRTCLPLCAPIRRLWRRILPLICRWRSGR